MYLQYLMLKILEHFVRFPRISFLFKFFLVFVNSYPHIPFVYRGTKPLTYRYDMKRLLYTGIVILLLMSCVGPWIIRTIVPEDIQIGLNTITPETIESHIRILASDSLQGRETTYPGQKMAAEYIANHFRDLGLSTIDNNGDFLQTIPMQRIYLTEHQDASVILSDRSLSLRYRQDFFVSPRNIVADDTITASVVFAGYGINSERLDYNDYANIDAAGKWVMVIEGEPQLHDSTSRFNGVQPKGWSYTRLKRRAATQAGAAGLIIIPNPMKDDTIADFTSRMAWIRRYIDKPAITLQDTLETNALPRVYLSASRANYLLNPVGYSIADIQSQIDTTLTPMSSILPMQFRLALDVTTEEAVSENVSAVLPGNDPVLRDEYVVLSAHYDHVGIEGDSLIFNGADDNASGTATVLAEAEAFMKNPVKPDRSIVFLLVTGEEKGLLGSKYFVENPLVPIEHIVANLNIDMAGRNHPDSIYVIGSDFLSEDLHRISEHAEQLVPRINQSYRYNRIDTPQRYYYRSDHYKFAEKDIPVIFYFSGTHEDYHKPTDTMEKLDMNKITNVSRLVYATAWGVANYPRDLRLNGKVVKSREK